MPADFDPCRAVRDCGCEGPRADGKAHRQAWRRGRTRQRDGCQPPADPEEDDRWALKAWRLGAAITAMKTSLLAVGLLVVLGAAAIASARAEDRFVAKVTSTAGDPAGKVIETMNAASYTYVLIDTGAKKVWAAAPQFSVKVGDTVALTGAMPMTNYQSRALNRTFDLVYFSGNVTVNGVAVAGAGAAPKASAGNLPPGHPPTSRGPGAVDLAGIKRAENGQTVEEIIKGKARFAGKRIAVRARVVKYNAGILGKNWLHIRDGSGAEGTNDLTVTTSATAKVGDLVLVTGVLSVDRDFGSGYRYGLIVEDASVVAQ